MFWSTVAAAALSAHLSPHLLACVIGVLFVVAAFEGPRWQFRCSLSPLASWGLRWCNFSLSLSNDL